MIKVQGLLIYFSLKKYILPNWLSTSTQVTNHVPLLFLLTCVSSSSWQDGYSKQTFLWNYFFLFNYFLYLFSFLFNYFLHFYLFNYTQTSLYLFSVSLCQFLSLFFFTQYFVFQVNINNDLINSLFKLVSFSYF